MRKKCHRCEQAKSAEDFSKNKSTADGYNPACKECVKIYYHSIPKEVHRDRALKSRYGLSLCDYEIMRNAQNGCCAICDTAVKLSVDHCHRSGKIRKLLCNRCNSILGYADDSAELLTKAVKYLDDTKVKAPDGQA